MRVFLVKKGSELPDWLLRVVALFDRSVGQVVPELGKRKDAVNDKARRALGWAPRSAEDAVVATAESLQRLDVDASVDHFSCWRITKSAFVF